MGLAYPDLCETVQELDGNFNVKKIVIFHNEGMFELNMFSDKLETLTFEYQPVNNAKENN